MGLANHEAKIVRITELVKHPNADSLSLVRVGGYQCVVRTDNYRVGDLAIYIQPDSVVSELPQFKFVWERDGGGQLRNLDSPIPERYRRVTVRKFRKEISEGLLMPASDFMQELVVNAGRQLLPEEGTDVAPELGITHWEPPEDDNITGDNEAGPSRRQSKLFPRSLKGWLYMLGQIFSFGLWEGRTGMGLNETAPEVLRPIYDVEAYKNFVGAIQPGETVVVTEKIHGSNARYTAEPAIPSLWQLLKSAVTGKNAPDYKMYAGSRKLWKSPLAQSSIWRKALRDNPWIEGWCSQHLGYTIYGEVTPTQKGYDYGSEKAQLFVFDIRTPDGKWLSYQSFPQPTMERALELRKSKVFCAPPEQALGMTWVPMLYVGPFDESQIMALAEGQSTVNGAKHMREGVVIRLLDESAGQDRMRGLGRLQLKIVSLKFLEKDNA